MFHHDITYAIMRERVVDLHKRAAADRRASRISRQAKSKHSRH